MPPQAVLSRERSSFGLFCTGEIFFEGYNVAVAVAQFIACFGFFPTAGAAFYEAACVIFAVTCFFGMFQSIMNILEVRAHWKESMTEDEKSMNRRERLEGWMYAIGMLAFVVGAIMFLPEVYEHDERTDLTAGTWLFVGGSCLFWFATFVNSLSVMVHHVAVRTTNDRLHVYPILSLGFGQFGSIAFIVGSFFYFPQVNCEECEWQSIYMGTYLYVIGAAFFVGGAASNMLLSIAKRRVQALKASKDGEKEPLEQVDAKKDTAPADHIGPALITSSVNAEAMEEKPVQQVDAKNDPVDDKPVQQEAEKESITEV